jgi:hypothetical protein
MGMGTYLLLPHPTPITRDRTSRELLVFLAILPHHIFLFASFGRHAGGWTYVFPNIRSDADKCVKSTTSCRDSRDVEFRVNVLPIP